MNQKLFVCTLVALAALPAHADPQITLRAIGKYATGVAGLGAAEIAAFDPESRRLFSVNGANNVIDVVDLSNPSTPVLVMSLVVASCAPGGLPTSVAVHDDVVAVAAENAIDADPGWVAFFNTAGTCLSFVTVGAGPDMVAFTPNGRRVLVANEGEVVTGVVDPEGSVAIIDMKGGAAEVTQSDVSIVTFDTFDKASIDPRIHRINPSPLVPLSIDLEPEYIAISRDSKTAWVTLQENNALAVLDIKERRFTRLLPLGFKNHSRRRNALDPSDRDGGIHIGNWPVFGMYQPDSIAMLQHHGDTFLITGNEGDSRPSEETRVGDVTLDATAFPEATVLQDDANLGRLRITNLRGDTDGDGDFDELYAFGARSFSIWTTRGRLVFDSGSAFERITAAKVPAVFNSNGDSPATFDTRSDDKGPEPEGVTIGKVFGRTYAFVGLERTGGIMTFDVSNPYAPVFVAYNHAFGGGVSEGDISPEGLVFVSADDSPNDRPLLIVSHEISGTITIYEIRKGPSRGWSK